MYCRLYVPIYVEFRIHFLLTERSEYLHHLEVEGNVAFGAKLGYTSFKSKRTPNSEATIFNYKKSESRLSRHSASMSMCEKRKPVCPILGPPQKRPWDMSPAT
jgi:hypothetical protein